MSLERRPELSQSAVPVITLPEELREYPDREASIRQLIKCSEVLRQSHIPGVLQEIKDKYLKHATLVSSGAVFTNPETQEVKTLNYVSLYWQGLGGTGNEMILDTSDQLPPPIPNRLSVAIIDGNKMGMIWQYNSQDSEYNSDDSLYKAISQLQRESCWYLQRPAYPGRFIPVHTAPEGAVQIPPLVASAVQNWAMNAERCFSGHKKPEMNHGIDTTFQYPLLPMRQAC